MQAMHIGRRLIPTVVARRALAPILACALLASATVVSAAKAPVKNGSYTGITSERINVAFKVSANGKRVQNFTTSLGYDGKCGQGGGPGFEIKVSSMRVARGKFSASTKGTLSAAVSVKPINVKVSGRVSGKIATGTVAQVGAFLCTTGTKGANPYSETFTASAG
jgi:hypothetical protein